MMKYTYVLLSLLAMVSCVQKQEMDPLSLETRPMKPENTEIWQPKVPVVKPGVNNGAPSDAIVLFEGTNLDNWITAKDSTKAIWTINGDGSMTVNNKSGDIATKRNFGSVQLHIEWRSPFEVNGNNQSRGNSGVYLQGLYEVQVLDNNDNDTYVNGQVGSIYKQSIPMAMASVPSGEWNTYDIVYRAPEFDGTGQLTKKAIITVLHNGILIQDHFEILGASANVGLPKYKAHDKGPLVLQDHGDNSRVSYRNIWLREL